MSKMRSQTTTVKGNSKSPWKSRDERANAAEDKRNAVLQTAAELFVTNGFHRTTLNDVAERLQITKPAIYYYFSSKDEILLECTRAALAASETALNEAEDGKRSGRERLETFMLWYAENMTTPLGQCLVRVAEQDVEAETQKQLMKAKRVIYDRLRALIEAGVADGSIAACDASIAAFTVAGALSWLGHWYRPGGRWSAKQAAAQVTGLVLSGIASGR